MDDARGRLTYGCGAAVISLILMLVLASAARAAGAALPFEARSLDGSVNNFAHLTWGRAGSAYQRLAPARYADGIGAMVEGPNPRYVSNHVFNSLGVDLFSERDVSQWVWVWGQFVDHTIGRAEAGTEDASIPFDSGDPLESFSDTLGVLPFTRDAFAPGSGTGTSAPREQVNAVGSYIDASAVYGGTRQRSDWLRTGHGGVGTSKAGARLLLPGKYLPLASARGDAQTAPTMELEGALAGSPQNAVVAGDIRANENAELTATTTLLAREHNRIVASLPSSLSAEEKFQIARRVVGAEEQYITYTEFLPAVGLSLKPYEGYDPNVDAELSDEFATVGYRAHSMVNGEEHVDVLASKYGPAKRAALEALGVDVERIPSSSPKMLHLTISQGAAFFDPSVVRAVGLGPLLGGLANEPGYKNDEQIDDALRSVLFGVPGPGADPAACFAEPSTPGCFSGVVDLGAFDIQRSRDNGMPSYNQMRQAVGLAPQTIFAQVTGESSEEFPTSDPLVSSTDPIDDPHILDFTSLRNLGGQQIPDGSSERAVYATRRTTLAARLKAIYGSVDNLNAFVGMLAEPHSPGSELGELQAALWSKQFEALRDGDRFFYLNDPALETIQREYGVSYRHSLAELITLDAGVSASSMPADVFFAPPPAPAP